MEFGSDYFLVDADNEDNEEMEEDELNQGVMYAAQQQEISTPAPVFSSNQQSFSFAAAPPPAYPPPAYPPAAYPVTTYPTYPVYNTPQQAAPVQAPIHAPKKVHHRSVHPLFVIYVVVAHNRESRYQCVVCQSW
jgi:hypothetical protein